MSKRLSRITLRDIASYTGYSVMAVSSVITGRGRIGEDARKEILAAAAKLGYTPDQTARGLRLGRSGLIALVINRDVPCLARWIKAVQRMQSTAVVVFEGDDTYTRLASCHVGGAVWFSNKLPKSSPVRVVLANGDPEEVLEKLIGEDD